MDAPEPFRRRWPFSPRERLAISIAVALAIWFYFYCSANHASGLFEGQMICIGVMMAFAAVLWGIRKMI
jgi:predicted membrane-bound mannosyltransferase